MRMNTSTPAALLVNPNFVARAFTAAVNTVAVELKREPRKVQKQYYESLCPTVMERIPAEMQRLAEEESAMFATATAV